MLNRYGAFQKQLAGFRNVGRGGPVIHQQEKVDIL